MEYAVKRLTLWKEFIDGGELEYCQLENFMNELEYLTKSLEDEGVPYDREGEETYKNIQSLTNSIMNLLSFK